MAAPFLYSTHYQRLKQKLQGILKLSFLNCKEYFIASIYSDSSETNEETKKQYEY